MKSMLVLFLLTVTSAFAAECGTSPDKNAHQNLNPIYTDAPRLIKSINCCLPNEGPDCGCAGSLYQLNDGINAIPIVHVYGTPWQMGYAQGLLRPDVKTFIESVYDYLDESVYDSLNETGHYPEWMPEWFFDDIINLGLDAALQAELDATINFTAQYFIDELTGLSKSTGVSLQKLEWVHLIGELTKGSCSMFGAWGKAIPSNYSLLQLRSLDWDMDGPFRDYPQLTVYHPNPNDGNGQPFVNVGYAGFIGSFSGMSAANMGTSEIGVYFSDDTFGRESRRGIPFTYLLRDILQFDSNYQDSINRITNANRTCDLILGFGDGVNVQFRGVEYSYSTANFYTDYDMEPVADWHPRMTNVVYYGMDWLCPAWDQVLYNQLNYSYGNITPELGILNITSILTSGDNFVSYYDLTPEHPTMFIAFASAHNTTGPENAYDRQFAKVDMRTLLSVPRPTSEEISATSHIQWNDPRREGNLYDRKSDTTKHNRRYRIA